MKGFTKGLKEYFAAIAFTFRNGMWWAYFVPVVLTVLFFVVGWFSVDYLLDAAKDFMMTKLDKDSFIYTYLEPLLSGLLWLVVKVGFFLIFSYINGYLLLIVMSPLLAYLSEKTEKIITGNDYPFSLQKFINDVVRGILIGVRNFFYETFISLLLFIIVLVPVLGGFVAVLLPVLMFFVSAYFYGFSFLDYVSERRGYGIGESVKFVRKNAGFAVVLGGVFSFLLMIPFIGSLLAGMAAVTASVAASKAFAGGKE